MFLLKCEEEDVLRAIGQDECFFDERYDFQKESDCLFLVNGKVAAASTVKRLQGKKCQISMYAYFEEVERILLENEINETKHYIGTPMKVPHQLSEKINDRIENETNYILYAIENKQELMDKQERKKQKQKQKPNEKRPSKEEIEEVSEHTKMQYYLKEIGRIVSCEPYIASNDQHRLVGGETLGQDTEKWLDALLLEEKSKRIISYIDVLWFQNGLPLVAFEVEKSTSIYSGLLRMSDLLLSVPYHALTLYIVAPEKRREKVFKEMERPTFKQIGLREKTHFLSFESVEALYKKIKGLDGFIQPDVLTAIRL